MKAFSFYNLGHIFRFGNHFSQFLNVLLRQLLGFTFLIQLGKKQKRSDNHTAEQHPHPLKIYTHIYIYIYIHIYRTVSEN